MKEIEKAVKLELYNFVVQIMCINKEQCKYFEAKENNKYYPFVDSEIREAIRFLEIQSFKDMLLQFLDTRQRCWEKRNCTPKDLQRWCNNGYIFYSEENFYKYKKHNKEK